MYQQNSFQGFVLACCQIVGHQEYKVNRMCTNKDCNEIKIACDLCERKHKTHRGDLVSIAEVQESFYLIRKQNIIDPLIISLKQKLDDFETQATMKLIDLVNNLKQSLDFSKLIENSFVNKKPTPYFDLEKQINQFLTFFDIIDGEVKLKRLQASSIQSIIQDEISKFCEELNNFWRHGDFRDPQQKGYLQEKELLGDKFSLQQQLDYKKPSLQEYLDSFQFSKEQCSQSIKLISPKCVRKIGMSKNNDVACLSNPLSLSKRQQFVFKINSLKGYIGIGVLIFQQIKARNFQFGQLNQIGHGIYMVLNNGVIFNNDYSQFNRVTGPLVLREGKKYRLIFDPLIYNKEFCFQEQSQDNVFSMPIVIEQILAYHVFVHLGEENGEVELFHEY